MKRNIRIAKELVRIANEIVATPNSDQKNDVSTSGSDTNHDWLIKNGYEYSVNEDGESQYEKTEAIKLQGDGKDESKDKNKGKSLDLLHWVSIKNGKIASAVYIMYKNDKSRTVKIAFSSSDVSDSIKTIIQNINKQAVETLNTISSKL